MTAGAARIGHVRAGAVASYFSGQQGHPARNCSFHTPPKRGGRAAGAAGAGPSGTRKHGNNRILTSATPFAATCRPPLHGRVRARGGDHVAVGQHSNHAVGREQCVSHPTSATDLHPLYRCCVGALSRRQSRARVQLLERAVGGGADASAPPERNSSPWTHPSCPRCYFSLVRDPPTLPSWTPPLPAALVAAASPCPCCHRHVAAAPPLLFQRSHAAAGVPQSGRANAPPARRHPHCRRRRQGGRPRCGSDAAPERYSSHPLPPSVGRRLATLLVAGEGTVHSDLWPARRRFTTNVPHHVLCNAPLVAGVVPGVVAGVGAPAGAGRRGDRASSVCRPWRRLGRAAELLRSTKVRRRGAGRRAAAAPAAPAAPAVPLFLAAPRGPSGDALPNPLGIGPEGAPPRALPGPPLLVVDPSPGAEAPRQRRRQRQGPPLPPPPQRRRAPPHRPPLRPVRRAAPLHRRGAGAGAVPPHRARVGPL